MLGRGFLGGGVEGLSGGFGEGVLTVKGFLGSCFWGGGVFGVGVYVE